MSQSFLIYILTANALRLSSCNLHCNILAQSLIATGQLYDNADLATHVDVGSQLAILSGINLETTEGQLFTDGSNSLSHNLSNSLAIHLGSIQSIHISRLASNNVLSNLLYQCQEVLVLGNEVSLGVNLNDASSLAIGSSSYNTLGSNAASLLSSLGNTLLTEIINSLVLVALALNQSLLAVHHACASNLAQLLNQCSSNLCHYVYPPQNL